MDYSACHLSKLLLVLFIMGMVKRRKKAEQVSKCPLVLHAMFVSWIIYKCTKDRYRYLP